MAIRGNLTRTFKGGGGVFNEGRVVLRNVHFGWNEIPGFGKSCAIIANFEENGELRMINDSASGGQKVYEEAWSCGKSWKPSADGKYVEYVGQNATGNDISISSSTNAGRLLDDMFELAPDIADLLGGGDITALNGLDCYLARKSTGRMKTNKPDEPVTYVGMTEVFALPGQAPAAPQVDDNILEQIIGIVASFVADGPVSKAVLKGKVVGKCRTDKVADDATIQGILNDQFFSDNFTVSNDGKVS